MPRMWDGGSPFHSLAPMLLQLFTPAFRIKLTDLAHTVVGRAARILAARFSLLLSSFGIIFVQQLFPGYDYVTLGLISCAVLVVGAVVAFAVPTPFIMLLRIVATDPSDVVLWGERDKRQQDES
jgi:hypothetical protein